MSFLLKIVEGPNRGAEIALVEGVAVTLGKGDDCDIVLADPTLPGEPIKVEVSGDAVSLDGVPLDPFMVKTVGATSFAVGPSEAPWDELKWPEKKELGRETKDERREEENASPDVSRLSSSEKAEPTAEAVVEKKRRGGCLGCLVVLILLLIALATLAWFFRADPRVGKLKDSMADLYGRVAAGFSDSAGGSAVSGAPAADLAAIAAKHGMTFAKTGDVVKISGNFKTRRERLAATAEAYAAQPGVELDLSDDESFRTAADDALFTLTEGALKVVTATNRFVALSGASPSPFALKKILEALNSDLPKLRAVDVSGVAIDGGAVHEVTDGRLDDWAPAFDAPRPRAKTSAKATPVLPVCGILTTPYPCLVLRNGARLLEGSSIGGSVILEIGADSVTLTNSTGRFTWKP